MLRIISLTVAFVFSPVNTSQAQQPYPHSGAHVFFETTTEKCTVKATSEAKWQVLRIKFEQHMDENFNHIGDKCSLSTKQTTEILASALKAHKQTGDNQVYNALMIGRVETYTWMQQYLMATAEKDSNWSQKTGKHKTQGINDYINNILSTAAVIDVFNQAGRKHGYRFSTMGCEKVFLSDAGLPYDAFCWIKMLPN